MTELLEASMTRSRTKQRVQTLALGVAVFLTVVWGQPWRLLAQGPAPATGVRYAQIAESDMREWLTYLASDELQGRQVFTEGYGRATQYIAERLKSFGVKPLGDNGTYFQSVKLKGYRVTRGSTVTLNVNGQTRTFKHGDHVTFAVGSGGKQSLTFDGVEFLGYGFPADYEHRDLKGKLIVTIPVPPNAQARGGGAIANLPAVPAAAPAGGRGRGGVAAGLAQGAAAAITFAPAPAVASAAEQALCSGVNGFESSQRCSDSGATSVERTWRSACARRQRSACTWCTACGSHVGRKRGENRYTEL
jgi:hypothetical protein